jgi:hypothetical protein
VSDELISRLRALARYEHDDASVGDEAADEIERLRQQVTQRGARMQLMREYLGRYTDGNGTLWGDFLRTKPHAASWFDADGVPK